MQTPSGRWVPVNLSCPLPSQPWPTTSSGDREEIRKALGVVESSEVAVALLQQAVASLQRAMRLSLSSRTQQHHRCRQPQLRRQPRCR